MTRQRKTERSGAKVDQVSDNEWDAIVAGFSDGTIYQSSAYGSVRWGADELSHTVLTKDGVIVGAAQVVIIKIPFMNSGIAYIPWGPLWRPAGTQNNLENLQRILQALEEEYCGQRGLHLRVRPNIFKDEFDEISTLLQNLNFSFISRKNIYRTLLVDLSRSQEELRKGLKKQWRAALRKAENNDELKIYFGKDESFFDEFLHLYREMRQFKYYSGVSPFIFREVQSKLPDEQKMIIMIAKMNSRPVSGVITSMIGSVALGLFAASNKTGRRLNASHLLAWNEIKFLKEMGLPWLDTGGVDLEKYPGGYQFKAGYALKNGSDLTHVDVFESLRNPLPKFTVRVFESVRNHYRNLKMNFRYLRNKI